jgi:uncharacterized membrane protein
MSVEMAAVVFDQTHTAERELSALRASRQDSWLTDVAVLEHHAGGRYSVKATSPEYGDVDHVGAGIAIGGGTGLLLGMIAGPLGLIFWTTMGAITGGVAGASGSPGAFDPIVDQVKEALPHGSSALLLVADNATTEEFVSAAGGQHKQVLRQDLTDEQVEALENAAVRA